MWLQDWTLCIARQHHLSHTQHLTQHHLLKLHIYLHVLYRLQNIISIKHACCMHKMHTPANTHINTHTHAHSHQHMLHEFSCEHVTGKRLVVGHHSTLITPPSQLHPHHSTLTTPPSPLHPHHSTITTPPSPLHPHHSTLTTPPSSLHPHHSTITIPHLTLYSTSPGTME